MAEYLESGMVFVFDKDKVWQPDKTTAALRMEHLKACDFVWYTTDGLWIVEAKSTVPPVGGGGSLAEDHEVRKLREKFINTLLMILASAVGRDVDWTNDLGDAVRLPVALQGDVRLAVVVSRLNSEWASVLQTYLDTAVRTHLIAFGVRHGVTLLGVPEAVERGIRVSRP